MFLFRKYQGLEQQGYCYSEMECIGQTECFENYAALHLDSMPWLSQKLHFVISIFRHFLFFMFRIQLFCRSEKQNKKKNRFLKLV